MAVIGHPRPPQAREIQEKGLTVPKQEEVVKWIESMVYPRLENLLSSVVRDMRDISGAIIDGDLRKFLSKVTPYIGVSFAVSIVFDLLQSSILGNYINLRKTVDKIDRLLNMELVVSTLIGVMVGSGVETPAKYFFNSVFTPNIPDIRTLSIGYFKKYYSLEELRRYYRYHGIHDKFHKLVLDLNDFTPSLFQIERIMRYYPVSKQKLEDWLRENGVTEDELDFWFNYLEHAIVRDEFSKLESSIKNLYVEGFLSDSELDNLLMELKAHPRERYAMYRYMKFLKMKRLYDYYIMKHILLFRRGKIDVTTLYSRLSKLYADKEFAQARTAVEAARLGIEWG
ncbi:MAG: hypothetical protein QW794_05545 [Thermosphaera sp.]